MQLRWTGVCASAGHRRNYQLPVVPTPSRAKNSSPSDDQRKVRLATSPLMRTALVLFGEWVSRRPTLVFLVWRISLGETLVHPARESPSRQ